MPGIGSAGGFGGKRTDTETFYSFTSFTVPTTIFRLDLAAGKSTIFRQPKVDFDLASYETKQVFVRSKDGTRVPMFITYRRRMKLGGTNPTLLHGYGGFNAPSTPAFEIERLVWMEMGGVYEVANLRGGGEYGAPWHLAGTKRNKQTCSTISSPRPNGSQPTVTRPRRNSRFRAAAMEGCSSVRR